MLRLSSSDEPDACYCTAVSTWLFIDNVATGWTVFLAFPLTKQLPGQHYSLGELRLSPTPNPAFSVAAPDLGRSVSSAGAVGLIR